jgi:rhodanese-related sulfurtransferase
MLKLNQSLFFEKTMIMKQMTAVELAEFIKAEEVVMVDVREEHELHNGMLDGAIHIPMNFIPERVNEIEQYKSKPLVLICRSGKRSEQVGMYLKQFGFNDLINLSDGMNGWAATVDKSMTVY